MYTSTRKKMTITASQAILNGLAPKGGLYVFKDINPNFFNKNLLKFKYNELTKKVFKQFLDDYSKEMISNIVDTCYQDNFIPSKVSLKHFDDFSLLELFNGETFAFKDMALSILPSLFQQAKVINGIKDKTIILTATSGDTGGAALSGFRKIKGTVVIVLYPKYGVSEFQELQMQQYESDRCNILGIDGNFDDCQAIVKNIFQSANTKHAILSSANSINIGRIIPQIVYYFHAYIELVRENKIDFGAKVNFTVPTGNFGNIYAGFVAKEMGLPIGRLIIASNANNVLTELFNKHNYNIKRELEKTISPSMDILISSNFERYLYELEKDPDVVFKYMKDLEIKKFININELKTQHQFLAYDASETETKAAIKSFYLKYKYLIDPHTAVAYHCNQVYKAAHQNEHYNIVFSTASPYKFSEAVLEALELKTPKLLRERIEMLKSLSKEKFDPRIEKVLDAKINENVLSLEEAYPYIMKVIGDIDDQN